MNIPEVMLETSVDLRMRSGIDEFWSWMDQVSKDQTEEMVDRVETEARESNTDTDTVTCHAGRRNG